MKKYMRSISVILLLFFIIISQCGFTTKKPAEQYYSNKSDEKLDTSSFMFYDDFSNQILGSSPTGYNIGTSDGCSAKIEMTETQNGLKKVLVLNDGDDNGMFSFQKKFDGKRQMYFKTSFKYTQTHEGNIGMYMAFCSNSTNLMYIVFANHMYYASPDMTYMLSGVSEAMVDGEWYDMEIYMDLDKGTWDFKLQTNPVKAYKEGNYEYMKYDTKNGIIVGMNIPIDEKHLKADTLIDSAEIWSSSRTGTISLDYVILDDNGTKVEPFQKTIIKAPYVATPTERPVPGTVNVRLNGKIIYFVNKAFTEDGSSYADGAKLLSEIGFDTEFNKESGILTAKGNGQVYEFSKEDSSNRLVSEVLYIPIRKTADILGLEVDWNDEESTVVLNNITESDGTEIDTGGDINEKK